METTLLCAIPVTQEVLGGIGRTTVYELMKDGSLESVKIGSRSFITRRSLEAYVDRLAAVGEHA
jgi:excisionase family DNA binding protein